MNSWSWAILFLCISAVYTQVDGTESDAQFASMRRTACLVLSRYHSNTQKDVIEDVVQSLDQQRQQDYINKIYATAVETCEPLINQSEVQEVHFHNNISSLSKTQILIQPICSIFSKPSITQLLLTILILHWLPINNKLLSSSNNLMRKWPSEEKNNKLKKLVQEKVTLKMKLKFSEFHSINFQDSQNSFTLQFSSQLSVVLFSGECKNSKLKTIRRHKRERNHQRKIDR